MIQWFTSLFFDLCVAQIGRMLTWEQGHYVTTTGNLHYRELLRKAYASNDYNGLRLYSARRREENIIETLTCFKHVEVTRRIRAQITSLSAGETTLFNQCLADRQEPADVEEVVQDLMSVIPPQLYSLLEEPVVSRKDSIDDELARVNLIVHSLAIR